MSDWSYEGEQARKVSARGGVNAPIWHHQANHDGFRSVRLLIGGSDIGLCTTAYSYNLTDEEKVDVARRMAAAWNYAAYHGLSTAQLEQLEQPQ